ncbi:TPA: exodeoxyribonuclease III, partial [Candidatus Micrarchaeota archaeon]|nr:exodeoxyribonuclease III [Candidatus Micrarchaeota archaeon]
MIFASWNVNGIRAAVRKGFWDAIRKIRPDIMGIQEIKASDPPEVPLDLTGYSWYWFPAEKKGYAGTAVLTRVEPEKVRYGIGEDAFDGEGRVITLEYPEFYVVNAYFPHAQRDLQRLHFKLEFNRAVEDYVERLRRKKPVVFMGDFNVAHTEKDIARPKQNEGNAGFTKEERGWIDSFLRKGWIDTWRFLHPDVTDQYTWWSYRFRAREKNIGWRIDYNLIPEEVKHWLKRAYI